MKTCHTLIVSAEKKKEEAREAESEQLEKDRKGKTEEGFVLQCYKCS